MKEKAKVLIVGAGRVGRAVGLLLRELGDLEVDLFLGDVREEQTHRAVQWLLDGSRSPGAVQALTMTDGEPRGDLAEALDACDLLLDCLPGEQAPRMAGLALQHRLHYVNLTEHVSETAEIRRLAAGADTGFVLQAGLAPGVVNVLGHGLFRRFCDQHGVERVDALGMRVGALPRNAGPPHFYAFTWSPIGVATEYLESTLALRNGQRCQLPALAEVTRRLLHGQLYEEATTSGGAADLPEALAGKVDSLDYKTLRYPGHYDWVREQIATLPAAPCRARELERRMREVIPLVEEDRVVLFAFVQGKDSRGTLHRSEAFRLIPPRVFGERRLSAIQATTAAGMAECARMLLQGTLPTGIVLQSHIDPDALMAGPYVGPIYDAENILEGRG